MAEKFLTQEQLSVFCSSLEINCYISFNTELNRFLCAFGGFFPV